MRLRERIHNAAERLHGKGKQAAGEMTGSERLKAEGKARLSKANLKQTGDKIRDTFRKH